MKFFKEFKEFIKKGNVLDLAVALLIGSAFTAIVNSLANDVIMPPISLLLSGLGLKELKFVIRAEELDELGNVTLSEIAINYGNFIQAIINFLILALCVFVIVKIVTHAMNGAQDFKKAYKAIKHDNSLSEAERAAKLKALKEGEISPEEVLNPPAPVVAEEPAPAPAEPVETQEDILRDIRELLKVNAEAAAAAKAEAEKALAAAEEAKAEAAATVAPAKAPAKTEEPAPAAPRRRGRPRKTDKPAAKA